jgi:hypothetical protein
VAEKRQQKPQPDKKKKSREKQQWAKQSGKNPDDLEVFTEPKKL